MNDEEMVAFFNEGNVGRFAADPPEIVRAHLDRLKQTYGIELESLSLVGEGILVWRKDRTKHPLDRMFMKATDSRPHESV